MTSDQIAELNAHQRAVLIAIALLDGEELTMPEIARRTGLSLSGARYMMDALTLIISVTEIDGKWQLARCDCTMA